MTLGVWPFQSWFGSSYLSSTMEFRSKLKVNHMVSMSLLFVVISALCLVSVSGTVEPAFEIDDGEDTTPWISTGQPGRFLLQNGRRGRNFCGGGRAPDFACRRILPWPQFRDPQCCVTRNNNRRCFDVGADNDQRCGSCTRRCVGTGRRCCRGVCVNVLSDPNNCGQCRNPCRPRGVRCLNGICGYNGRRLDGDND